MSGFPGSHNSCIVFYAVVKVLVNEAVLPDNQTYASKNNPPTTSAISTAHEQRLIKVKRDYEYYKMRQREYEMTKRGENVIEWDQGRELVRVGIEVRHSKGENKI